MRIIQLVLTTCVVLALAACGGQGGEPEPEPDPEASLGSSSLAVRQGELGTLELTVSNAEEETVTFSASGAPSGVDLTFSPTSLDGSGSTTVTVDASNSAPEGNYTITVTATVGGEDVTTTFTLTVTTSTVDGQLVDAIGQSVSGVEVAIGDATATTDGEGRFSISGVTPPYDLVTHQLAGGDPVVHQFARLESFDPVVTTAANLLGGVAVAPESATIEGELDTDVPTGSEALVCVEGVGQEVFGCDTVFPQDSDPNHYEVIASWAAGTSATIRVHALEYEVDSSDAPTNYTAYGVAGDQTVTAGDTVTLDTTYGSLPPTTTASGTIDPPTGFTPSQLSVMADVSDTFSMPVLSAVDPEGETFTVPVPDFEGSYQVFAVADAGSNATTVAWQPEVTGGSTINLALAVPSSLDAPSDGTAGVDTDTTFSLQNVSADTANTFVFTPDDANDPLYAVTTTEATATLPDATALGVSLPSSADYQWAAISAAPVTSMAEAGVGWIGSYFDALIASTSGGAGASAAGMISTTDNNTFTTQ